MYSSVAIVEWLHGKCTGSSSVISIEFGCVTFESATTPKRLKNNRLGLDPHILVQLKISFINTPRTLLIDFVPILSVFVCVAQAKRNIAGICYLATHNHKFKGKLATFHLS
jgi:hypothetical protein